MVWLTSTSCKMATEAHEDARVEYIQKVTDIEGLVRPASISRESAWLHSLVWYGTNCMVHASWRIQDACLPTCSGPDRMGQAAVQRSEPSMCMQF